MGNFAPALPGKFDPALTHVIDPEIGSSLIRIGFARPPFGSQFPIMEMQARFAARIVTGKLRLPDADRMRQVSLAAGCDDQLVDGKALRSHP